MRESDNLSSVPMILENGALLYIEGAQTSGEEKVAIPTPHSFQEVTRVIEGISESLVATFKKAQPSVASVEFGLEIGLEAGQLTTLLVKGTSNATLKVKLVWGSAEAVAALADQ